MAAFAACSDAGVTTPAPDPLQIAASRSERHDDNDRGGNRHDRTRLRGLYGIDDDDDRGGCRSPQYREFDFWLGTWRIANPAGEPRGVSEISRKLNGCLIDEFYTGGSGRSISRFDRVSGQWHQDYIDNTGFTLRLFGARDADGLMQMKDEIRPLGGGFGLASRFTWTPNADGTVRQLWNFSQDGGTTFFVNFNGIYTRDPAYVAPTPPTPLACLNRPADRVLDGLIGRWLVRDSRGKKVGVTSLTLGAASCLLEESFRGDDGYRLTSFIYRDRFVGQWFRAQVDNAGNTFRVGGPMAGTTLQMLGTAPGKHNAATPVRLTWDLADASQPVQLWEVQNREGAWVEYTRFKWTRLE